MVIVKNFRGQDYHTLKKNCLATRELFEDPEFPAANNSISFGDEYESIVWKRPKELCSNPRLIVEAVSSVDLNPGDLGNTWFVTACASLIQEPKIWQRVFPDHKDQEWDPNNSYVGMFRLNLYRFGQWIEVVVDDRLPTRNDRPIVCHSENLNEFWVSLLEKAYAKLFGNYEYLTNGQAVDALVDFTGGVAETLELNSYDLEHEVTSSKILQKLVAAIENHALIVSRIRCAPAERGCEGESGLILGHSYALTKVVNVQLNQVAELILGASHIDLVCLFNPWNAKEWTGSWSDGAIEWKWMDTSEWEKYGIKFAAEGYFWMAFHDYLKYFTHVDFCHLDNTSLFKTKKRWCESIWHSQWTITGMNGGGEYNSATNLLIPDVDENQPGIPFDFYERKFIFKFLYNPQYAFDITGHSDHIMVSLTQRDIRGEESILGHMNTIGFHILKVESNRRCRVHIPWEKHFTSEFTDNRSVFGAVELVKGRYVVLPATYLPGRVGQFMVRLFTTQPAKGRELKDEAPCLPFSCLPRFKCVTSITVVSVKGLVVPLKNRAGIFTFVTIKCESEKVVSALFPGMFSSDVNCAAVFYRKNPNQPIVIEVRQAGKYISNFLGKVWCENEGSEYGEFYTLNLYGRDILRGLQTRPGTVEVFIRTSTDITLL